jgi:hypothetical protein
LTVGVVAGIPLNFTVGASPKLDPLIVTGVPTTPELGINPLIVGPDPPPDEAIVPEKEKGPCKPAVPELPSLDQLYNRNSTLVKLVSELRLRTLLVNLASSSACDNTPAVLVSPVAKDV